MSVSSTAYKHSELEATPAVHEIFLKDTKAVCTKMLDAQEEKAAEWKDPESTKVLVMQVDDLLNFQQSSKNSVDDTINYDEDVGRATGRTEIYMI